MSADILPFQPLGTVAARVVANIEARKDRDQRGKLAGDRVKAAGGSAMDATLEHMAVAFDRHAIIADRKIAVLRQIKFGIGHPGVRARYGERARWLLTAHADIDTAIWLVDRWLDDARRELRTFGRGKLSVDVLSEMRLMLRMLRRSAFCAHYIGILQFVGGETALQAAE